jgi:hypothetical protein
MDFQNFASTETTTLIGQLLANQSGAALHQLNAVRDALEAVGRALSVPAHVDQDVHQLVERLTRAADADVQRIREEAAAALDAAHGEVRARQTELAKLAEALAAAESEVATLRTELHLASARGESLERDLGLTVDAHAELEATLKKVEADWKQVAEARQALEAELAHAQARVHALLTEIDLLRQQHDEHAAEKTALHDQLTQARHAGEHQAGLEARLAASQARIETLEAGQAQHEDQVRQLATRLEDALQSEARLQEKLTARGAEAAAEGGDVEVMRAEVDRMVSLLDASARAVTEMAAATTSTGLLTELLKRLSLQFSRVALFRLKGNRLEGEQQIGFDDATDVTRVAFPVAVDSILSRAVSSGAVESLTGDDVTSRTGLPFGGAPRAAVALPILLQGSTLAVVYADDSDMPDWARGPAVHESSVGFARLLVGQVSVLLLRHTHELKTLAELRQYATTLLLEAKEMYLADAQSGKNRDLLRRRLKDNLDCASQLYAYRAAMEGTAAAALLDEQIAVELEESSPFAEDLAKVVGQMTGGELQITAEAS